MKCFAIFAAVVCALLSCQFAGSALAQEYVVQDETSNAIPTPDAPMGGYCHGCQGGYGYGGYGMQGNYPGQPYGIYPHCLYNYGYPAYSYSNWHCGWNAVNYPYYTLRGPRDFLTDNPPTIGN